MSMVCEIFHEICVTGKQEFLLLYCVTSWSLPKIYGCHNRAIFLCIFHRGGSSPIFASWNSTDHHHDDPFHCVCVFLRLKIWHRFRHLRGFIQRKRWEIPCFWRLFCPLGMGTSVSFISFHITNLNMSAGMSAFRHIRRDAENASTSVYLHWQIFCVAKIAQ